MSIPVREPGHVIQVGGGAETVLIEVFSDFTCPFSARMWKTLFGADSGVATTFPSVRFVFRQVVQPWHPQSTLVHESAFAARRCVSDSTDPRLKAFFDLLFAKQEEFFDINVWNSTRADIQRRLIELTKEAKIDGVAALLAIDADGVAKGFKNPGSFVTPDLKAAVRFHRQRSVHVTPTVYANGIEATAVSSSWTVEQWVEFLTPIVDNNNKK